MTNEEATATKELLKEVLVIAAEEGRAERERLGRDLTEAEAANIADMVMRQLRTALALAR